MYKNVPRKIHIAKYVQKQRWRKTSAYKGNRRLLAPFFPCNASVKIGTNVKIAKSIGGMLPPPHVPPPMFISTC